MELSGLQIFKYLPAAKKSENSNCKKCGFPTCMAYALKLAKHQADLASCPYIPEELNKLYTEAAKQPQKTVEINNLKIGGENVLYRHEKTFINKTTLAVIVKSQEEFERVKNFEITRVNETMKVDLIITKDFQPENCENANVIPYDEFLNLELIRINDKTFVNTAQELINIRNKAVKEKDEQFSNPVCVVMQKSSNLQELCAKAAFYICKYANMLVFENFDEALFTTLMTLRQNIFTDPQKPLQVEAKIYEFNNPDENSLIFMTTNFALTFFAVANELESLPVPSYLIVTPADGMSVLTAWSAEKFTAKMVAKTLKKWNFASKVKNRKIIIPGLLAHMKEELEEELKDFEIVVGTIDAFAISDFVKNYNQHIQKRA